MATNIKKKCKHCGVVTPDWDSRNGGTLCYSCRKIANCVHIKGTVITVEWHTTVNCMECKAAWQYGSQPPGMQLFDVRGQRWY
jgi:hypothetical protein